MSEIGSEQGLALHREFPFAGHVMADVLEAVVEECFHCVVAIAKFGENFVQHPRDLSLRQAHYLGRDPSGNFVSGGAKWPHEDTRTIRHQSRANAFYADNGPCVSRHVLYELPE